MVAMMLKEWLSYTKHVEYRLKFVHIIPTLL